MRTRWKVMGGAGLVGAGFATLIVLGHSRVSRGDSATTTGAAATSAVITPPTGTGTPATSEPITDTPAESATGWEQPAKDPFAPYDIGSGGAWSYDSLSAAEKARVDKGRDTTGWDKINNAYATASAQVAHRAAARASAVQLGLTDDLSTLGVVP